MPDFVKPCAAYGSRCLSFQPPCMFLSFSYYLGEGFHLLSINCRHNQFLRLYRRPLLNLFHPPRRLARPPPLPLSPPPGCPAPPPTQPHRPRSPRHNRNPFLQHSRTRTS